MATQTVEFFAAPSQTITAKLFAAGSDTEVASVTATEATNRKGVYTAAYTDVAAGTYRLLALVGTTPVASWWVDLTLTTATFVSYELPISKIADSVWDEPYNQHTTAGTFGKLMDLLRKSNLSIDGTVTSAIAPTTLTFSSNVAATTSAYAHAVLLFTSGPLEGENSPIISYNNTNGVFVLEEPLTAAPTAGDEFVVIAGSHVHAIADIQAGLALQTTSLAIKAKTDLITSGNISVLQDRVNDNTITMQYNENTSATVNLDEDTTSATLQFVVARPDGTDVLTIANGAIARTSSDFTVTITMAVTATIGQYLWSLRDLTGGGNRVVTKGVLTVQNAASIDA